MNEIYQKYLFKLRTSCDTIRLIIKALEQTPQCMTKEDIDARIKSTEALVNHLQDVKRGLLYFRNRLQ